MIARPSTQDELLWLMRKTSCALTIGARGISCVGVLGALYGVIALDDWTPSSVALHIAIEHPIALRKLIPSVAGYAFLQAGKALVTATIPDVNEKSCRMVERLGFRELARVPGGWSAGHDRVIYGMSKAECVWLKDLRKVA